MRTSLTMSQYKKAIHLCYRLTETKIKNQYARFAIYHSFNNEYVNRFPNLDFYSNMLSEEIFK